MPGAGLAHHCSKGARREGEALAGGALLDVLKVMRRDVHAPIPSLQVVCQAHGEQGALTAPARQKGIDGTKRPFLCC